MNEFKDLRIVDNFYQTSSFFPMPTTLIGSVSENGQTNLGAYSLCFPYYIAGKERYAMLLQCRLVTAFLPPRLRDRPLCRSSAPAQSQS